jgi:starch phosphorylase
VVFLEDYDIDMARHLVAGVDVWLNTPIRPHEASGTSGQKASLNGVPNCSIIDGWWEEGYDGANGWAIGEQREYHDAATRDETDALALYDILEHQIVPAYYERGLDGVPHHWVSLMKNAIRTLAPAFSMRRMLKEYTDRLYVPAYHASRRNDAHEFKLARELANWKQRVAAAWGEVSVRAEGPREGRLAVGQSATVDAYARLGALSPDDVTVELVAGVDENGTLRRVRALPMRMIAKAGDEGNEYHYQADLEPDANGSLVYGVRLLPCHPGLTHPYELGLGRWA